MDFWEVFAIGIFIGIFLGIGIGYLMLQLGLYIRKNKKIRVPSTFNNIQEREGIFFEENILPLLNRWKQTGSPFFSDEEMEFYNNNYRFEKEKIDDVI